MSTTTIATKALLPEVQEFLTGGPLTGIVGGLPLQPSSGRTIATRDPGTGQVIAEVYEMSAQDVECAIDDSARAFRDPAWAELSAQHRGELLRRLADTVEKRLPVIAQLEAIDAGKIYAQACGDVQNFVDTLRYYADVVQQFALTTPLQVEGYDARTLRHPWGVCGFIFPWNFPILLLGWGIAPALAAGNTVVVKPAEDSPLSTLYVARLAREVGFPAGVINVVTGAGEVTGAALASNPRLKRMSFTGSPEVGRQVAEVCGRNLIPVKLELGGKGAAVVFDDVDISETAGKLSTAITFHAGQVCCNATRWLVHRKVLSEFVDACTQLLSNCTIGYQLDHPTQMGPVVNARQRQRILDYLDKGQQQGAELLLHGGPAEVAGHDGYYVKPALMTGTLDNVAAQEEIFGPVAYISSFDDEDEAIGMANDTDYGLANSVWTSCANRANRVAESLCAGNAWINAHNLFPHGVPYGGIHKSGLGGGVLSPATLCDYVRSMSVVRPE